MANIGKKGRGRPKKDKPLVQVDAIKRKRGRPRKNPLPIETDLTALTPVIKKGRGRPKKNFVIKEETIVPSAPIKVGKHVGYCPHCDTSVSTLDCVDQNNPNVFFCYKCNKDVKQSSLLEVTNKSESKYKSKREYLEDCLKIADDTHIPAFIPETVSEDFSEVVSPPEVLEGE